MDGGNRPGRLGNWKFIIGGLVVALVIGYMVFNGMQGTMVYYQTVSELKGNGPQSGQVRVAGIVVDGSIQRDVKNVTVNFTISDADGSIPVSYKGVPPDTFKDGASVVVEGRLDSSGAFVASNLLAKCPSKYESELKR
jgi:cytochrome c-type biogenesis protein CcmE